MLIQNGGGSCGSLCGRAVNFLPTRKETEQDVLPTGRPSKKKGINCDKWMWYVYIISVGKATVLRDILGSFTWPKMVRHHTRCIPLCIYLLKITVNIASFACINKNKWPRGQEHQLLFHRILVPLSAPTWQHTTVFNYSSRGSDAFLWIL